MLTSAKAVTPMSNPTQDNAWKPRNVSYPTAANFYGNHNRNKVPKKEPARTLCGKSRANWVCKNRIVTHVTFVCATAGYDVLSLSRTPLERRLNLNGGGQAHHL